MIPDACKQIIMKFGDNESIRRGLIDLFNAASNEAQTKGLPASTLVIPFYDNNLKPGDWAPELHIVVRKVVDHEEQSTP